MRFVIGSFLWAITTAAGCGALGPLSDADAASGGDASAAEACPETAAAAAGAVKAGESCRAQSECAFEPGEIAICDANNQVDQQQKIQRCHVLGRGRRGDSCSASRTAGGVLLPPTFDDVFRGEFPATSAFCDARELLACDRLTHTCEPLADIGQSCSGRLCVRGAYCSASGTCAARLPMGEPCDTGAEFLDQSWCDEHAYCDISTPVCVPRLADGAPCLLAWSCASNVCRGNLCVVADACSP